MVDNLTFTRIWQDVELFQIEVICKTASITLKEEIYTTDALIEDLYKKIGMFLSESVGSTCWENGTRGNKTTPCMILRFFYKDRLGHIQIEVFLEIDDGGDLYSHNCCFYVDTDAGQLYQFKENLLKLKEPTVGISVSLNNA